VLGWSLGAGVALQLAIDSPTCVRSLVLFGFTASFGDGAPTLAAALCRDVAASPALVSALGVQAHGVLLALLMGFRLDGARKELAAARSAIHAANTLDGYRGTVSAWRPFDVTQQLHRVRCGALHLHTAGDGSPGGHTAAKKARDVALMGAKARMLTQPGPWSHAWPFEHPSSFNGCVLDWLQSAQQ
jgi:pimeloyl-ACP methyl ester carboxylesterase